MVDYKQSLTASGALRRIRALARFDLEWVEEPVPARATPASAKRPRSPSRPARTGGSGTTWPTPSRPRLRPLYARHHEDGGRDGLAARHRAGRGGRRARIQPPFVEASAHVLPVTPPAHYLEYLDLAGTVLADPPQMVDGAVTARGPGFGTDWDEAAVARYLV